MATENHEKLSEQSMPPRVAELAKRIVPILIDARIKKASVFGSFVRGENTAESDLDLLVEYGERTTLLDAAGLKMELEEVLGCEVDLVSYDCVHPRLKERVFREQVRIL